VPKSGATPMKSILLLVFLTMLAAPSFCAENATVTALPGTQPLTMTGDIASSLVDGVDQFLLRQLDQSVERRERFWNRNLSSADAYVKSIEPNRKRLAYIIGVRDQRVSFRSPEIISTINNPPALPRNGNSVLSRFDGRRSTMSRQRDYYWCQIH
jgi:hypothetical protein